MFLSRAIAVPLVLIACPSHARRIAVQPAESLRLPTRRHDGAYGDASVADIVRAKKRAEQDFTRSPWETLAFVVPQGIQQSRVLQHRLTSSARSGLELPAMSVDDRYGGEKIMPVATRREALKLAAAMGVLAGSSEALADSNAALQAANAIKPAVIDPTQRKPDVIDPTQRQPAVIDPTARNLGQDMPQEVSPEDLMTIIAKQKANQGEKPWDKEFTVDLAKGEGDKLGIDVGNSQGSLIVVDLFDGLVKKWNSGADQFKQVAIGDFLLEVNGKSGDPDTLRGLLREVAGTKPGNIKLLFGRDPGRDQKFENGKVVSKIDGSEIKPKWQDKMTATMTEVPLFSLVNAAGEPLLTKGKNADAVGFYFLDPAEAQNSLGIIKAQKLKDAELRVVPLSAVFLPVIKNPTFDGKLLIRPDEKQVKKAKEATGRTLDPNTGEVPLFYSEKVVFNTGQGDPSFPFYLAQEGLDEAWVERQKAYNEQVPKDGKIPKNEIRVTTLTEYYERFRTTPGMEQATIVAADSAIDVVEAMQRQMQQAAEKEKKESSKWVAQ